MQTKNKMLTTAWIATPLGEMVAIADSKDLYLLEFFDRKDLAWEIERLQRGGNVEIIHGRTTPIDAIERELVAYFSVGLQKFTTTFFVTGTPFQQKIWQELQRIAYGQTRSYAQLAATIDKPTAFRAVALANASNQLALVIPCHRVINTGGTLGGYGAGVARKQWLLEHEQKMVLRSHGGTACLKEY